MIFQVYDRIYFLLEHYRAGDGLLLAMIDMNWMGGDHCKMVWIYQEHIFDVYVLHELLRWGGGRLRLFNDKLILSDEVHDNWLIYI